MTVAIAWTRTISGCEELIFVTDSRLSGDGRTFDCCPKVLTLPRTDCAIAFAGYTGHAYPMMQQLALAIDAHAPLKRGSVDLSSVKTHALKIFDSMSGLIQSSRYLSGVVSNNPEAQFIFGGYSWIKKQFEIWTIKYVEAEGKFTAEIAQSLSYSIGGNKSVIRGHRKRADMVPLGKIAFAGDQSTFARELLLKKLSPPTGIPPPKELNWEPFEVVRDMLKDQNRAETIGGAPQIVKVYQYMKTSPLGVFWPDKKTGVVHLQGRPCLGYERIDRFVLDPDTLISQQWIPEVPDETPVSAGEESSES
jgi:hypothetical protein